MLIQTDYQHRPSVSLVNLLLKLITPLTIPKSSLPLGQRALREAEAKICVGWGGQTVEEISLSESNPGASYLSVLLQVTRCIIYLRTKCEAEEQSA